jgi:hypothetical protein
MAKAHLIRGFPRVISEDKKRDLGSAGAEMWCGRIGIYWSIWSVMDVTKRPHPDDCCHGCLMHYKSDAFAPFRMDARWGRIDSKVIDD